MSSIQARQSILTISIISAAIVWLGESLFHFTILDRGESFELFPSDFNELWMRTVICALIVIFGIYAQRNTNKMLDVEAEKSRTLKATINTVHDRVGNSLAGIKMMLGDGKTDSIVDEETHQKLIILIDETFDSLRNISNIEKINEKRFHNEIYHLDIDE